MVTVSTMLMAVIDKRILVPMQVVLLHDAVSEESQSTVGGGGGALDAVLREAGFGATRGGA